MADKMRETLLDFLMIEDDNLKNDEDALPTNELLEMLFDKVSEAEVLLAIVSTAYENMLPHEKFDVYQEEVLNELSNIKEGQALDDDFMDAIAKKHL